MQQKSGGIAPTNFTNVVTTTSAAITNQDAPKTTMTVTRTSPIMSSTILTDTYYSQTSPSASILHASPYKASSNSYMEGTENMQDDNNLSWKHVPSKRKTKRSLETDLNMSQPAPKKNNAYEDQNTSLIGNVNKYAALSNDDETDADDNQNKATKSKPPPYIYSKCNRLLRMIETFGTTLSSNEYSCKTLSNNTVKVSKPYIYIYNISCHTNQPRQER